MRRSFIVALAAVAAVVAPARAQVPLVPGAFSIAAGLATPVAVGADVMKAGFTGEVGYRIGLPLLPIALRAEASYTQFGGNAAGGSVAGINVASSGKVSVMSYGGALELTVLPLVLARGYVLASAGYTQTKGDFWFGGSSTATSTSSNGLGYGVGAGFEFHLPVLPVVGVEARYRFATNALGGRGGLFYLPITARMTF
jgi:hypothetical protein